MPLMTGSSKYIIGENIRELRHRGYPEDQAIAIAMDKAHRGKPKSPKSKKKKAKKASSKDPFNTKD